jgi:hypothetical protein
MFAWRVLSGMIVTGELYGKESFDFTVHGLDGFIKQVLDNCIISDAKYAGFYSVCGLVLRLRDLYKWEKGLAPWIEEEPSRVLEWIGNREDLWEKLADNDLCALAIDGRTYDPFDTQGINEAIEPLGLFYGAGYVHSLKPTFFLARLEAKRTIHGCWVYILGRELARDLLTLPALTQDSAVVIRREAGEHFLWNQMLYLKKSGQPALRYALQAHGLADLHPKTLQASLSRILAGEMGAYIHHELGELYDCGFKHAIWRELIAAFPHTPIELLARALKDLLADTNERGTLPYIIRERKKASLGFYVAFLDGLRKALFPEMLGAFYQFMEKEDWRAIGGAVSTCQTRAMGYAQTISDIFETAKKRGEMEWAESQIDSSLLKPLGIGKERRGELA